jgi:YHS domain-containing protein
MNARKATHRDPVCGMMVDADQFAVVYQQMHFAFCSQQCKDRFLHNPHLYIGSFRHAAPGQEGYVSLKQRRLKLDRALTPKMADRMCGAVRAMMGIERIEVDGDIVKVTYDLMQATEAQIEAEIARAGAVLGQAWSERLRRAFVHYLEETEIESLAGSGSSGGHCH